VINQKEAVMASHFKIDDFSNPRYIFPALGLIAVAMSLVIGIRFGGLPFPLVVQLIIALMGLTAIALMIIGTLSTRQARIRAEADQPRGQQRRGRF
jgi:hypothetical protein